MENENTNDNNLVPPGNTTTGADANRAGKGKGDEMVSVPKSQLETILKKLEKQDGDIAILREVADKNRLTRVEEMRAQGKLVKKVNLNTFEGSIIIGWKKIKDDVYMDSQGRLHEDQIVGLYFEGDKEPSKELDIRSFARLLVKLPVEVIEEGKDKEGNINFTVQLADGKTLKLDSKFIN